MAVFTVIHAPSRIPILRSIVSAIAPALVSAFPFMSFDSPGNRGPCVRVQDGSTPPSDLRFHIRRGDYRTATTFRVLPLVGRMEQDAASEAVPVRYNLADIRELKQLAAQAEVADVWSWDPPKHGPNLSLSAHCATTRAWYAWKTS